MKKLFSRLAAVLLPVVLVLSLMTSASAAGSSFDKGHIWDLYGLSESEYWECDVSSLQRPGMVPGNFGLWDYASDEYYRLNTSYIFDETSSTFYNYFTDRTYAVSSWTYDEEYREYTFTLSDGLLGYIQYYDLYVSVSFDEEPDPDFGYEIYTLSYLVPLAGHEHSWTNTEAIPPSCTVHRIVLA